MKFTITIPDLPEEFQDETIRQDTYAYVGDLFMHYHLRDWRVATTRTYSSLVVRKPKSEEVLNDHTMSPCEPPLPEGVDHPPQVEGHRWEARGYGWDSGCQHFAYYVGGVWVIAKGSNMRPHGNRDQFYVEYIDISPPPPKTTLRDMVGDDGQKQVWLVASCGKVFGNLQLSANMIGLTTFANRAGMGYRWSNTPFISYEDANEFIVG